MDLEITHSCSFINWDIVAKILKQTGMASYSPDIHRAAFEASYTTSFVWHSGQLIGFGRAISDGVYQAAVYDVAVIPDFQGKGIGTIIMKSILNKLSSCNVVLYAATGKEDFYKTLGFRKMKTGMALFKTPEIMAEKGFIE